MKTNKIFLKYMDWTDYIYSHELYQVVKKVESFNFKRKTVLEPCTFINNNNPTEYKWQCV